VRQFTAAFLAGRLIGGLFHGNELPPGKAALKRRTPKKF